MRHPAYGGTLEFASQTPKGGLADPHRHVGETLDALLGGRMRTEEPHRPSALDSLERIVDEQLAGGRVHIHRNPRRSDSNLFQGAGQLKRLAGDPRTGLVGVELPCPRDRKSDQHCGERGHDERDDDTDQTQRVVAISTTKQRHPTDDRYRCAEHCGDGTDEDVPVLDMGQLVGEYSFQLTVVKHIENPGGNRHSRFLGAAPGGERIWLWRVDEMNRGDRHVDLGRQPADNAVELGLLGLGDGPGSAEAERHLVGEEVGEEVETESDYQRHHKAAAEREHDEEQQRGHEGKKSDRLQVVHSVRVRRMGSYWSGLLMMSTLKSPKPRG